jgi:hypothetical protein
VATPPLSEWDFSKVQDSEVIACYDYEFARENARLLPSFFAKPIEVIRRTFRISSFEDFVKRRSIFFTLHRYQFFLGYPEWPGTPYLDIEKETRHARSKALGLREPSREELVNRLRPLPRAIYLPENRSAESELAARDGKKVEIFLRPEFTRRELEEAFNALLDAEIPQEQRVRRKHLKPQGRAGRSAPQKQALRELGVYRLRRHLSAKEIKGIVKNVSNEQLYFNDTSVYRASASARKRLAHFGAQTLLDYNDWVSNWLPLFTDDSLFYC